MTEPMKPAVIYAAKSTEDKHGSIPTQLADGRELAAREGLTVVNEDGFKDEAASAFHGNRGPGLAAAMAECERLAAEHGSCSLIVQHSDRLSRGDGKRGVKHLLSYALWALENEVTIRSVQDAKTFDDLVYTAIEGHRNHEDSKRKGQAVKDGLRRAVVERGKFFGGRRPYGYRYEVWLDERGKRQSRLAVDPAEAAVVRRIFAEYVAGRAQNAIARDLMHDGVPTLTPTGSWYATTIAGILRNPLYIGMVTLNGEHFPAIGPDGQPTHEPIIDRDVWEKAQQLRTGRHEHGRPRGRRTAGRHLLTEGLLRCTCGAAMSPVTKRDQRAADPRGYETYVCVKRLHHGPEACAEKPIKRALIDSAVYDYFESVALDVDSTRATITEQANRQVGENEALREQAERDAAKADAALARIEGDYIDGKIGADAWSRLESRLRDELDAARAQIEQYDRRRDAIEAQIAAIDAEAAMAEELAALRRLVAGEIQQGKGGDLDQLRAVLRRLFTGFALASPNARFGSATDLDGQPWVGHGLGFEGGYYLIPVVRHEAVDVASDDPAGFPAVQRAAFCLSDNLCARLAA